MSNNFQVVVAGGVAHQIDMGLVIQKLKEKKEADQLNCHVVDEPNFAVGIGHDITPPAVPVAPAARYLLEIEGSLIADADWEYGDLVEELIDSLNEICDNLTFEEEDSIRGEEIFIQKVVEVPLAHADMTKLLVKHKGILDSIEIKVTPIAEKPAVYFSWSE